MTYNPFSLEGKKVLITGASSGIGQSLAIECSKMGASIIATGRNEERLKMTLQMLETRWPNQYHESIVADLTDESSVNNLVSCVGDIDGLVNNAGVNRVKPISFIKDEDLEYVFNANTFASVRLTRLLSKKNKLKKNASIVFTSSVSAFFNAPGRALYAGSKAAVTSFMRSFAVELASKGIRANAVHPGMIETRLIHEHLTEEERDKDMADYPLKRYGKPEEVSWAIIYLLSDASAWVTGTSLIVDGGFMLK